MAGIQVKEGEYTMTIYGLVSNFYFFVIICCVLDVLFCLFFVSGMYYKNDFCSYEKIKPALKTETSFIHRRM